MNTILLKTMPIFTHRLEVDMGGKLKVAILQDFNCRFTKGYLLINIFLANRGYYVQWGA